MRRTRTKQKSRSKDVSDQKIREIEDFPNPERTGCPPISEIKLLADKPLEGKDWVLGHISFCSPCYRNFAHFLHVGRKKFRVKSNRNE